MNLDSKLNAIRRGNTCEGVNRLIVECLLTEFDASVGLTLIDVPCGNGEFLDAFQAIFPKSIATGAGPSRPAVGFNHAFLPFDGENPPNGTGATFDIATCISGVMEFDNTLSFFRSVRGMVEENGIFIVTNDNLLTIRDRLLYLFSGRFGQYPFRTDPDDSTWKIIPAQNLIHILGRAGFSVEKFEYVPVLWADWFWVVLALPFFLLQNLSASKGSAIKRRVFNLRSFLSRHYVVVCRPANSLDLSREL